MIGIYKDSFKSYLEENLGDTVKIKEKNIICRCPWCEIQQHKSHFHLWIAKEAPIFHCFMCHQTGLIGKLVRKISGIDSSSKYIDKDEIKKNEHTRIDNSTNIKKKNILIPELNEDQFIQKSLYMKKRLKFSSMGIKNLKGLIFDFQKFLRINNIPIKNDDSNMSGFIQSNFVGFLTEKHSQIIFRNIDNRSRFKYYKFLLEENLFFLDYYKVSGGNNNSNVVVVTEGIFDLYTEYIFDYTNLKKDARLYAAGLSTSYKELLKSIAYNEQIFKMKVYILSDRDVNIYFFKKLKKEVGHIIDTITVLYNKTGEDFNYTPISIEKITL